MPFFDFLRPKQEQPDDELAQVMEQLKADMFPGGEPQIEAELTDLGQRLGGRFPVAELKGIFMHATARFYLLEDSTDEPMFRHSVMNRPAGKALKYSLTLTDAAVLYEFMVEKFTRQHYHQKFGEQMLNSGTLDGLLGFNNGTTTEQLPGASGEFGHEPSNPIPVKGIMNSTVYLGRLRTPQGEPVRWKRLGSLRSDVSPHPIDGYEISDANGEEIAVLYLSPYEQTTSHRAPKGFMLA